MPKTKHKGREQRRKTPHARSHLPSLDRFYRYRLPPAHPGDFAFHLDLLRPRHKPLPLDHLVDTFNWVDEQATLTGSFSAHRPDVDHPELLPLTRGQMLRCRVRWSGGLYVLWTMRLGPPQIQKDTNTVSVELKDDMILLEAGSRDWIFRATKHRKYGYFLEEIVQAVAARLGLKVGLVAKGTKRMTIVKRQSSALDALRAAAAQEKQFSGRGFIIRLRNGRLDVVTIRRNPIVYTLGRQIQTALIAQKDGAKAPTTVLTGRGHIGKGKGAKKISYTAFDRRVVGQLGYVHDTTDYGKVGSHAELRANVKRDLAKGLRLNDTVTITHQGIPFLQRGDGAKLWLPSEGYSGDQAWVYCTRANHTVSAGVYTTDWDFNTADPFLSELNAEKKAAKARAAARARKKKKVS